MTATEPRFARVEERTYTAKDLLTLTGATYRQLDYWCSTKALVPQENPGSGNTRRFTANDVDVVYATALIEYRRCSDCRRAMSTARPRQPRPLRRLRTLQHLRPGVGTRRAAQDTSTGRPARPRAPQRRLAGKNMSLIGAVVEALGGAA